MLFTKNSLSRRVLGTVVLLYLTVGLWMFYVDATAFKEAIKVILPGRISIQQHQQKDHSQESSYLNQVLPYANPGRYLPSSGKNEDVFIMFRTSSTTIWRRGLMHLRTTLREPRHFQIYSDYPEDFAGHVTIDALEDLDEAKVPADDLARRRQAFELRASRPDIYWESLSVPGDDPGSASNWNIDKYKFMPVLQHAYQSTRDREYKWYLLIEDDTFVIWDNLMERLKCHDSTQPMVLGHYGWRLDQVFPHGGAGMVLSRAAMDKVFGNERFDLHRWQSVVAKHHTGDHVLGMLLHEHKIEVNEGNRTQIGFESDSPHHVKIGPEQWNSPVLSVHHVHQRDISELGALQVSLAGEQKAFTYGRMFRNLIWPYIPEERACWDNGASEQVSVSLLDEPRPNESAYSKEACQKSCEAWNDCLMWRYDEDGGCHRDSEVALGAGVANCDEQISSGWMRSRIESRMLGRSDEMPNFCSAL